jgi:serine/threonine protein kinase
MCPDENTLTQFARGGAPELPALEAHLDACEQCRRAVAAAASEQTLPGQQARHELSPGLRVGRYEIERELGRGGMGVVYQARDVTLDRRVALKLLHSWSAPAQARLLREAQVMAKLAHPNVVPVFELGEWRSDLYLVMELVTGVTLEAWLKRVKHRRSDIINHFLQAGRGLAAAHAAGVVHRDFKPANVLVGLDERVRVTDFGLSRPGRTLELPATDSAVVTRDGAIVGTLAYMAPEQLDGKVADERSDQFAFCVALVEALAGQRPFKGETWSELAVSLGEKPVFTTAIPSALRTVLRKGLEREPSHRYASMTALLNAIERAQKVGWGTVAGTGLAAVVALGLISAARMQPVPATKTTDDRVAAALAEDLVPVVTAAYDLKEGTVITMEMIQQRSMPSTYVTSSVIKPDSASYILGQLLNVSVQKGDTLLWSQFGPPRQVKPLARLGGMLGAPSPAAPPPPMHPSLGLTMDEIMGVITTHHEEISACTALGEKDRPVDLDLSLGFSITAGGNAIDIIAPNAIEPLDAPIGECLVQALSTWKFPTRKDPTFRVEIPIRVSR